MGKVLNFPGPHTLLQPNHELLLSSAVPDEFNEGLTKALDRGKLDISNEKSLAAFFQKVIEWACKELGLNLREEEKMWLTDVLTKCKNVLSAEKALWEIIDEASQVREKIQRGMKMMEAGNLGLMASGGFVDRRHFNHPAYYAYQTHGAYQNAAHCLDHPLLHRLTMEDRVPLLSSVIRLIRILCGTRDPLPAYKYVSSVNPSQGEPFVKMGFHLKEIK